MNAADVLERIAKTLREDIGPALEAEFPKTQAFMAAVVLQKLGREIALAASHRAADAVDITALCMDLARELERAEAPPGVKRAATALADRPDSAALAELVEALYGHRSELGDTRFASLLGRVRQTLRSGLDRRLEYAR